MHKLNVRKSSRTVAVALALAACWQSPTFGFVDDFEDGDTVGWLVGTRGGTGNATVVDHNGSLQARVTHAGAFEHTLVHDFAFDPTGLVSFDMEAAAVAHDHFNGFNNYHSDARAGVRFTFLNAFNVAIGQAGLFHVTSGTQLGLHDLGVDFNPHTYNLTIGELAELAGLNPGAPAKKLSISFEVSGGCDVFGCSSGTVWFDNVRVNPVPEPEETAMLLVGGGLLALHLRARRLRKNRKASVPA